MMPITYTSWTKPNYRQPKLNTNVKEHASYKENRRPPISRANLPESSILISQRKQSITPSLSKNAQLEKGQKRQVVIFLHSNSTSRQPLHDFNFEKLPDIQEEIAKPVVDENDKCETKTFTPRRILSCPVTSNGSSSSYLTRSGQRSVEQRVPFAPGTRRTSCPVLNSRTLARFCPENNAKQFEEYINKTNQEYDETMCKAKNLFKWLSDQSELKQCAK